MLEGTPVPILHESQLASLLGLPAGEAGDTARTAGDTVTILTSWCGLIKPVGWDLLTAPTRSRGRALRNLTVNVFHPFELLPLAWRDRFFAWDPDLDEERETELDDPDALHDYALAIAERWAGFVAGAGGELGECDPTVDSPRGQIAFSHLLEQQRWHAAFHHRQLVDFLRSKGRSTGSLDLSGFAELDLPAELY